MVLGVEYDRATQIHLSDTVNERNQTKEHMDHNSSDTKFYSESNQNGGYL